MRHYVEVQLSTVGIRGVRLFAGLAWGTATAGTGLLIRRATGGERFPVHVRVLTGSIDTATVVAMPLAGGTADITREEAGIEWVSRAACVHASCAAAEQLITILAGEGSRRALLRATVALVAGAITALLVAGAADIAARLLF